MNRYYLNKILQKKQRREGLKELEAESEREGIQITEAEFDEFMHETIDKKIEQAYELEGEITGLIKSFRNKERRKDNDDMRLIFYTNGDGEFGYKGAPRKVGFVKDSQFQE